ncbi:hypothetical protein XELAEV_18005508mg [Xenopus laevis]|uniref:C2 domain-containing protein n=1 Tax=Xenopus laevis TaxID=8355 RepID=A0A974DXR7_XENLA|nr:hypothetical protein XELAEV_18005508mg [Xenopus laevis]
MWKEVDVDVLHFKVPKLNNSEEIPTARVEVKIQDAKRKFHKDTRYPVWKQKLSFPLKDPRKRLYRLW